jgi:membrane fusion protein, heavy metal efflux system
MRGSTMRNEWLAVALLGLVASTGCGRDDAGARPDREASEPSEASREPSVIRVNADLQKKWGVAIGQAARATVTGAITIPGTLRLDPGRTAQVTSPLEGTVVAVGAQVGDEVRPGQVLVTISAPAMAEARIAYLRAGSRLEQARREFERAEALLKQEAIDQKEHLRRRTDLEHASADFAVAESKLHSYGMNQDQVDDLLSGARRPVGGTAPDELAAPYVRLLAPAGGRVVEQDVVRGEHVEPQTLLLTVADLSTLWAMLDARETELPRVAPGQQVRITTAIYPGRVWSGRVRHIADAVDAQTRTVKVRVEVPNDGRLLKPNMFVQGELPDAVSTRDVITLPEEAIQTIGGEPVVFVPEAADRFAARPVELGERIGARRAVVQGIADGERVVTAGAFNLKAELLKSTLAGE